MRRKITILLLALFLLIASGALFATFSIDRTTSSLSRLIILHQIESLRQDLIISVQATQSDLYTYSTPLGNELDSFISNVQNLDHAIEKCTACHHSPEVGTKIEKVRSLIVDYKTELSAYITASSNGERIDRLKLRASSVGNDLLINAQDMSFQASRKLQSMTSNAMNQIGKVRIILYTTIFLTFFFGILVAVYLTSSITKPIDKLLQGTRAITSGELGYTIPFSDSTEFGELASKFNEMSSALLEGYEKLRREIDERKRTEEALRESKERYALAARGSNDGLWDWDLIKNRIYFSPRWKAMLGYGESEIGDAPEEWFDRVHPDDRLQLDTKIMAHINNHSPHLESEHRVSHKDGTYRWVHLRGLSVRDNAGRAYRLAGSQTDITERKVTEDQLLYDAFHDALTGLHNRALFMDRLQHVMKGSHRSPDYLYAVLFLDMDRFKMINDSLGHTVGDHLLIAIARKLPQCIRKFDTVARLGGDEFAILLENISNVTDAEDIVKRMQTELSGAIHVQGHEIFTSASVGIVIGSHQYAKPEEVLRDADIAMYQAKARGKSCYEIFDPVMRADVLARLQLEDDLRRAVEHQQFLLHFQPIMDIKKNHLIGFESLVRWNHPVRGLIYPLEFITPAEEMGLIGPLGEWIVRESCRQLKCWQRQYSSEPPLKISINISAKQFSQGDLSEKVGIILKETELDPGCLALEITESMIMDNIDKAVTNMGHLRKMGVHIHIDDFGTGYSSLSYIHRFPINALKIDRSFIHKMSVDRESREIIKAIIAIANNLKLDVIAEGVELESQLQQIRDFQCRYGQGFYFSRPMAPEAVEKWIKTDQPLLIRT